MFGCYDIELSSLECLKNEYLIKSQYENTVMALRNAEELKYKFLFLYVTLFLSIVSFGFVNAPKSIDYLDLMLYGLFGLSILFTFIIAVPIKRYKNLSIVKNVLFKKIVEFDIK